MREKGLLKRANRLENLLQTCKGACELYVHGAEESSTPQVRSAFTAALNETLSAAAGTKSLKGAMFDLYQMMALLVEVAQKQRDASREMRLAENLSIQKSILNQAEAQREAAMTGMIAGAICCALQVAATGFSLYQQAKAFNSQLGTDKTAGLDVARQNVDMIKAANTQDNAQAQLAKVKAEVGGKLSSDGHSRISSKVEGSFGNQQFNEASANFEGAKGAYQSKTVLSQTMQALGSDANIDTVTSDMVAPFEAPEVAGIKTAVAKLMTPDATDSRAHLADVEDARMKYQSAQQSRANSVDYIKASNTINNAQATNNLIAAIGGFAQGFIQNITQYQQAEATKMGAEQKKSEEELDQTRDLFNQAEELVNSVVQLMQAVRAAETQSMRDAIQA